MKTYQDLQAVGQNEEARMQFIQDSIDEYKSTEQYMVGCDALKYADGENVTISKYQKLLYTLQGQAVPDNYSANHKCKSGFFKLFTMQEVAYLLKNGVTFEKDETYNKLGGEFNNKLYQYALNALSTGVSYGFFNLDHIDFFKMTEFVPLMDEENGSLRAGIRFWQIDSSKPLRATLYEEDGYTDYIKKTKDVMRVLNKKRTYVQKVVSSKADGTMIYDGENYPSFPIVPLWAHSNHKSELVGLREDIDCYDLIKSGFANDLDDASMIYWTLTNTGGMDDVDLARFKERMKTVGVGTLPDEVQAQSHTQEVPYNSREVYLRMLSDGLYRDGMALDVRMIAAGNITATQIDASYEPLDEKATDLRNCITAFLQGIFKIAGIEDTPTFNPSRITNKTEETQMVLMAAEYLDDETILEKLPFLTDEEVDKIMEKKIAEDAERFKPETPIEEPIEE